MCTYVYVHRYAYEVCDPFGGLSCFGILPYVMCVTPIVLGDMLCESRPVCHHGLCGRSVYLIRAKCELCIVTCVPCKANDFRLCLKYKLSVCKFIYTYLIRVKVPGAHLYTFFFSK